MKVKVGINGYGTIGKRAATAVGLQDDMEVVGVTKTRPTYEAFSAAERGLDIYVPEDSAGSFAKAGIRTAGTIGDLCRKVDIMVDCTPGNVAEQYKAEYAAAGIKGIFQGGEDHSLTGISFNAAANYKESWGAQFSRVVSCNTTGLVRTLFPVDREIGIKDVFATLIRRSADPGDSKNGPVNAIEPSLKLPTHHGPDVQSIMPWLNIETMAVKVPTTLMHLHTVRAELDSEASADDILEIWRRTRRIRLVKGAAGVRSSAQIMEMARDIGRSRGDMYEIAVWEDGVKVIGNRLYFYQAVHQESDVIPEIVDCIRSMCKTEESAEASMGKTDAAMGISV